MFRSNLTIFLQERFDTDYTTLGKIMSFNGIAAALAAATCGYISRLYSSPTRQMTHLLVLLALSLLAATCAPNLLVLVAMIIPQTIATSNLRICTLNSFLERVSDDEKGHVIGMGYSITSVSRMLAPSFVGVAQEEELAVVWLCEWRAGVGCSCSCDCSLASARDSRQVIQVGKMTTQDIAILTWNQGLKQNSCRDAHAQSSFTACVLYDL